MSGTIDYEIENVGGVKHAQFVLTPGVNVLSGRNAIGKTSAMRAIVRAQGGKMPLERRDGTERGTVSGPGVMLRVGKVVHATGEAELELAETGPLARLIDPGIKSTEAAARERVRALVELLDLAVDDDSTLALCPDDGVLLYWLREVVRLEAIDDLMVAAERLRGRAHSLAREEEEGATDAAAGKTAAEERSARELEKLGGIDALVDDTPDEAKEALDGAIRQHERALAHCEARQELEAKRRSIHATRGERPEVDLARSLVSSLRDQEGEEDARVETARELMERAKGCLERAKRERESVRTRLYTAISDREDIEKRAVRWDEQDAILREPLTGPTPDEVRELQVTLVEAARRRAEAARLSTDYHSDEAAKVTAEREQKAAEKNAKRYRQLAAGIPARLGEILQRAGAPGLTVVDGRLNALREGDEPRDFEHRCSTGERVALALDVAATAYQGKVLPLDGAFWMSLDPKHQAAFARLAEERGLFVLTEEPTGGELRVEQASSSA